jgi:D-glycero-D-manno-heptose 1,7-bisphosphate phosphatase
MRIQPSGKALLVKSAVFLDRDGVLNLSIVRDGHPFPPLQLSEVQIHQGVIDGVNLLRDNGFEIVVVTNQPDVARSRSNTEQVKSINQYLGEEIGITHFYTCFHDDEDNCSCRKPKIGLFLQAAMELDLELTSSFMVGDRWRDIEAGQSAGCICYFIDYSYTERKPPLPYFRVASFFEAAQHMTRNSNDAYF